MATENTMNVRVITTEEMHDILHLHMLWLINSDNGVQADFTDCIIENMDLDAVELRQAIFCRSSIKNVNFRRTNLEKADFRHAYISCVNFRSAILWRANFEDSRLIDVSFKNAILHEAQLAGVYLGDCALSGADLCRADLRSARGLPALVCPEKGSFIGFKKSGYDIKTSQRYIIKLKIHKKAMRSSATSRKCRCSEAKVLSITTMDGKKGPSMVRSDHDKNFIYRVGRTVKVDDFDPDRWHECTSGIHFFITREEAVAYL